MAFRRTAKALVEKTDIKFDQWVEEMKSQHDGISSSDHVHRIARTVLRRCDPKRYLLSHATIVASVDTVSPDGVKTGKFMNRGVQCERRWTDFRIKPECHEYINNNQDSWARQTLLSTYRTFIGAPNYLEHIQLPELAKGFLVDAIARDLGTTCYIDILVATDRKHKMLVNDILSGKIFGLSMGCLSLFTICTKCGNVAADDSQLCFPPNSFVTMSDGTQRQIAEVVPGDLVVTHTGNISAVSKTFSRHFIGDLARLDIEGIPNPLRCTPDHPIFALRPAKVCACGCGEPLPRTVEHKRNSVKSFQRRFIKNHFGRIVNPNPHAHNVIDLNAVHEQQTFSFVEAKDVIPGDYLGFPIPNKIVETDDGIRDKARLIGYFLAEGCYIKRNGKRIGISFSFGKHEFETLASETRNLLNSVFGKNSRHDVLDWKELLKQKSVSLVRHRTLNIDLNTVCPRCSAPSDYIRTFHKSYIHCKICDLHWRPGVLKPLIARLNLTRTTSDVRMMGEEIADFFFTHCGEYSNEKRLSQESMLWPQDIQREILFGWLNGDGNNTRDGVKGNTTSFHLVSQMHMIAARCGFYTRTNITFGGKGAEIRNVVNGDGTVSVRDERGWLPLFHMTIPEPVGFTGETRFIDKENLSVKMRGFFTGFKRVGDYLVYRVTDKSFEPYHGDVHNLEVEEDSSYLVEGVAVHNCPCVTMDGKGSKYADETGVEHPVSELIGHVSIPNSNQFIEASWVRNPAFRGAVRRNILNPTDESVIASVSSMLEEAGVIYDLRRDVMDFDLSGVKRAASLKTAQDDPEESNEPAEDPDKPKDEPEEPKDESADEPAAARPKGDSLDAMIEKAQQLLVEKLIDDLARKMAPKPEDVGTATPALSDVMGGNDNLVRSSENFSRKVRGVFNGHPDLVRWACWAHTIVHRNGVNGIRQAGITPRELIVLSWIEDVVQGRIYSPALYKVSMRVGSLNSYPSEASFLASCGIISGKRLSISEKAFLSWKGKIASLSSTF